MTDTEEYPLDEAIGDIYEVAWRLSFLSRYLPEKEAFVCGALAEILAEAHEKISAYALEHMP